MPRGSFTVFRVERFPDKEVFGGGPIVAVGRHPEVSPEHPDNTELRHKGLFEVEGYELLEMTHRSPEQVEGWHNDIWIRGVIAEEQFLCYYNRQSNLFIAQASRSIARSAVNKLNSAHFNIFALWNMTTDLAQLLPYTQNLKGAWFGNTRHSNVRSEACHGDLIQDDDEFRRLSKSGDLTALRVELPHNGVQFKAIVSAETSVYLPTDQNVEDVFSFIAMVHSFSQ